MLTSKTIISVLPQSFKRIFIAYSGGVDSHVLLDLTSSITEIKTKIIAVYVDHGLQSESASWTKHCQAVCLALDVKFHTIKVNAQRSAGQSQEEVARDARYHALRELLSKDDVLLVAQHQEDQMETVLLQLFRGAGVQGLSGMPVSMNFGKGLMCRPFLDVSKQAINNYAEKNNLHWIEDPSNASDEFKRNFLRNKIVPQLKQHWPALDKTITRSARHCANSHKLLQGLAKALMKPLYDDGDLTLNITGLLKLEYEKQSLVLRQWLADKQLKMPSEKNLNRIINEVALAKQSASPEVQLKGFCIRRYRNKLYCLKTISPIDAGNVQSWATEQQQIELKDGRVITLINSSKGIPKKRWENSQVLLKFRQGAERIVLPDREGGRSLKKIFQEKSVPPWERNNVPLIYLNGRLAVVVGYWISAEVYESDGDCYQIDVLNTGNYDT
ncbi:MAG: tRNA lysidine(34) synthetase TilS [Methylococcales bacterium]|nr:tRNA lysidine(34) synthetase TilS [Methylococcales bacterium]